MTDDPNQSLEELLFGLALDKPTASERNAFLDSVCGDNTALRAELDKLLATQFGAKGFLPRLEARRPPSTTHKNKINP